MDSAVELAPGALAAALRRLQSDAGIGAVGGKLVGAHGRLEAAGGIVWRDGTTLGYLRDGSPLAPEANFVRDVDFCSTTFLLLRAALLHQLEGFDEAFAASGYADVDLCLRIAEAGSRVVYDPAVVVSRLTQIGPGPGRGAASATTQARQPVALPLYRRPPCRGIRALDRCRTSRAFHRRFDTTAPAWFGLRALERPHSGNGFTRLSRHAVSDQSMPLRSCHHLCGHARHGRGDARPHTRGTRGLPRCAAGLLRRDLDRAHPQSRPHQANAGTRSAPALASRRASCSTPRRSRRCARRSGQRLPALRRSMSMRRSCGNSPTRMSASASSR